MLAKWAIAGSVDGKDVDGESVEREVVVMEDDDTWAEHADKVMIRGIQAPFAGNYRHYCRMTATLPNGIDKIDTEILTALQGDGRQTIAQLSRVLNMSNSAVTERVRQFRDLGPEIVPLPHPSWRTEVWERRNPWFAELLLPALREKLAGR